MDPGHSCWWIHVDLSITFYLTGTCDRYLYKCAFSWGGLTVSKMCHSLSSESVHAATVLGSWCQFPDAIPWDEIEVAFRDKSKHPKAKESFASTSEMIQVDSD